MAVNLDSSSNNTNKPTHVLGIETEHGRLQISLFANNKFHATLIASFNDGSDISPFLKAVMSSAKIEAVSDKPTASQDLIETFRNLNVKA